MLNFKHIYAIFIIDTIGSLPLLPETGSAILISDSSPQQPDAIIPDHMPFTEDHDKLKHDESKLEVYEFTDHRGLGDVPKAKDCKN